MRQKCIVFQAEVDITEELPFDRVDVCALFANALDNAMEACMRLPEGERRITLVARLEKGMLAVRVRNPCAGRLAADFAADGILRTTKEDVKNHGFGLRSIGEVVKKYGGNMEIEQKGEELELFLYLPCS